MTSSAPSRVIVVALDHTPTAAQALSYALDNVVRQGDKLVLLSVGVTDTLEWADVDELATGSREADGKQAAEQQATELLRRAEEIVKHRFANNEQITVVTRPVVGSSGVHNTIVEICDTVRATMLVIGSRNLPGLKRIILGSTSDDVAHKARCPVLIVKENQPSPTGGSRWPAWAKL
ncbi:uncharacterized protein EV422DRAFT_519581 [Fimicolochytrium jonesii]|uniref:uncharacterized protein n=1 Tax=Fimicolochytrium jonesii TaxID=1396493 RepID=UPI0022FE5CE0|nr:uncharacterized protein EV422DRAFT_519581 [Fimicolochytrium jonesii]KAI8824281.1 hypothetical protein EV422DRAFT_519581 [Fimicolochytrium jonesii]